MEYKTIAYHTRKADQLDELGSLASRDGDKVDAARKFAEAKEHRAAAHEIHLAGGD